MSYKLIATWSAPRPEDQDEFEKYYWDTHVPAAAGVPAMRDLVLTRTDKNLEGADPAFYRVAELVFDDEASLLAAAESAQWAAMRDDAGIVIEKYGVTLSMGLGTASSYPLPAPTA